MFRLGESQAQTLEEQSERILKDIQDMLRDMIKMIEYLRASVKLPAPFNF